MLRLLVAVFLLATAPSAVAAYMVNVGSFQDTDRAQRARTEAQEKLSGNVDIVGVDTPGGYHYRVVVGPFAARSEADASAASARSAGFDGAWVSNVSGSAFDASAAPDNFSSQTLPSDDFAATSLSVTVDPALAEEFDFPEDDHPSLEQIPVEPTRAPEPIAIPEAIETEPPPGYRLHRLRR